MKKTSILVSTLALSSVFASSAIAQNYCAGIRGNGELAPAHWSSLSRIVEHKGLPSTVAGGSSAAITMFLLDSLSRNENVSTNQETRNSEQALLLKTLVPHIMYLYQVDAKAPIVMRLVGNITGLGEGGFISKLRKAVKIARDLPTFLQVLAEYGPLLNPELVKGLKRNFSFYKAQISEAVSVFGSFDAKTDMNLFYREGLVDFKYLGILFGRVGDFYAGYGADKVNTKLTSFLNECSEVSKGRVWSEIVKANPTCETLFTDSLNAYYEAPIIKTKVRKFHGKVVKTKHIRGKRSFPNKMIFSKVGSGLNALPTTTLVTGNAVERYKSLKNKYEKNQAKNVQDFTLDFNSELSYGYWGNSDTLAKVEDNLDQTDLKSSKFKAIENGMWFEVLGTSPAEPGLSNLQRIPDGNSLNPKNVINKRYFAKKWGIFPSTNAIGWFNEKRPNSGVVPFREGVFSAGGWSDLHPTLVLKANGCDDIVYITRQGGESVFGQQIFIRLTGYTEKIRFWKQIKAGNRKGWRALNEVEQNSPWNQLYNLANPDSSFNKSLEAADAVYCTDWDKFNVLKGEVEPTLIDAFNAPVFVKDETRRASYDFGYDVLEKSEDNFPGCLVKDL